VGYTTEFSGRLTIDPPLDIEQVEIINDFCNERHAGPVTPFPGMPGIWCDWEVSEDGDKLYWNGSEKSYYMPEWLRYLVDNYFKKWGRTVTGRMLAEGEERTDVWILDIKNDVILTENAPRVITHGITD